MFSSLPALPSPSAFLTPVAVVVDHSEALLPSKRIGIEWRVFAYAVCPIQLWFEEPITAWDVPNEIKHRVWQPFWDSVLLNKCGDDVATRLNELKQAVHDYGIFKIRAHFDPNHPNLATRYSNLATVLQDLGELPEARRLLERAIARLV